MNEYPVFAVKVHYIFVKALLLFFILHPLKEWIIPKH